MEKTYFMDSELFSPLNDLMSCFEFLLIASSDKLKEEVAQFMQEFKTEEKEELKKFVTDVLPAYTEIKALAQRGTQATK